MNRCMAEIMWHRRENRRQQRKQASVQPAMRTRHTLRARFPAVVKPSSGASLSVMMIPLLGVFSGAVWLNERLFWQAWAAGALMVVSIASVLWPSRQS